MEVDLPSGLSSSKWTSVKSGTKQGFVLTEHLVEIAYVKKKTSSKNCYTSILTTSGGKKTKLLWGDTVQIIKRGPQRSEVRARGSLGKMDTEELSSSPLLEVYFIDVGQGDGLLVRTPDGRHLMIDGGLERKKTTNRKKRRRLRRLEVLFRLW